MGKKKSDIYVCFQILPYKNKANKSIFQCKFCDRQYLQNATKMESHIITQCQKVPAAIRASYTTKPGNGGGSGAAATIAGLNLSLMNKHDDLDLNDLIRDYSDSSASEAPEQMVVNVSVPAMLRIGKGAAGSSGGSSGSGRGSSNNHSPSGLTMSHGRNIQPPKSSPPAFTSLGYPSAQSLISDFNQRSMQIRAYSQLVGAGLNSMNSNNNASNGGTNNRKRARLDNHASNSASNSNNNNNNNSNSVNNNNYYALGGAGTAHKILIKPSHGVPAAKLPNLGNSRSSSNNHSTNNVSATSATLSASGGNNAVLNNRKVKPPVHVSGATITKNATNNNIINSSGLKEKLSREETVEIWRLLARAIYSSDVPVTVLDNEHWANVFQRIQPSLTLPSTSVLSNALVDQEYSRIGQDIEEKVEKSHFSVLECISVPGNKINEMTLVFFLTCDDSPNPYLYKTHRMTDAEGYTKDSLSKIIEDTILDIGLTKVVAFMSDLTPEMEGTWEILRDKFPGLLTFGCVIHGLTSILDKILTLSELSKMLDVVKKLFTKIEKSPDLKNIIEEALKGKYESPFSSEDVAIANGPILSSPSVNSSSSVIFTKWKLVGKLMSQLISEKAVYQQLVGNQEAKKILDGVSDSPGKSDRSLSNHLGSESFWTSLHSINSITVPCLQWIDSMKPNRDCSLSEVPEVFKELKILLQTHLRNFPVDDTTKQSVQKHFLSVQRTCVNEIHFTASLLSPNLKLRGVLTEDEEAQGMEFLTYFCDSRGYHAGSILRELSDYKSMSGLFATEKLWKLGQTLDVPSWWKMVQGESALSNIAISLARVVPSCSIAEPNLIKPNYGELLDTDKSERLAFIKYNLQMPNKTKLPRTSVVVPQRPQPEVPKEVVVPPPVVPAKIEKLRIKIPRKGSTESPAIDLSARLSGCSQVSDEEEEEDDASDSDDEESSSVANSVAHNSDAARKHAEQSPPRKPDDDQTSDAEDGSTKDVSSSSDSESSSSDDQSD